MTAISARSGNHKPEQVYCLLHVLSTEEVDPSVEFVGLVLELSTKDYIDPTGTIYLPCQPEKCGQLKMFTTDSFVEYLLDIPSKEDPAIQVVNFRLSVLNFEDFLPSIVKVVGTEFALGEFTWDNGQLVPSTDQNLCGDHICDGEDAVGLSSASNADTLCAQTAGDTMDQGNRTMDLDLLSILESDCGVSEPPPKRPRKRKEQSKADTVEKKPEIEPSASSSLLDDPSLGSFLDDSDIAAFKHVESLCVAAHKFRDIYERRADTVSNDISADSDSEVDAVVDAHVDSDQPVSESAVSTPKPSTAASISRSAGFFSEIQHGQMGF